MAGGLNNRSTTFRSCAVTFALAIASIVSVANEARAACSAVRSDMIKGTASIETAETKDDFLQAADYFKKATRQCPDAYFNLGVALDKAERYEEAAKAFKDYLIKKRNAPDAQAVRDRIAVVEMKAERVLRRLSANWKIWASSRVYINKKKERNRLKNGQIATLRLRPGKRAPFVSYENDRCFRQKFGFGETKLRAEWVFFGGSVARRDVYVSIQGNELKVVMAYKNIHYPALIRYIKAVKDPKLDIYKGNVWIYPTHYFDCDTSKTVGWGTVTISR